MSGAAPFVAFNALAIPRGGVLEVHATAAEADALAATGAVVQAIDATTHLVHGTARGRTTVQAAGKRRRPFC